MMVDRLIAVATLAATAGCGYLGASVWAIPAGAVAIASLRSEAHFVFSDRYAALGRVRAWALFAGASVAGNALWCVLAFGLGRAMAVVA